MIPKSRLPNFVKDIHEKYDRKKYCRCWSREVKEINKAFKLEKASALYRMRSDVHPVFFAGRIGDVPYCLVSLNPHFDDGKRKNRKTGKIRKVKGKGTIAIDKKEYDDRGWYKACGNYFEMYYGKKIDSKLYRMTAKVLAGLTDETHFPDRRIDREKAETEEYELLSKNLVNLDILPYHSQKTGLSFSKRSEDDWKPVVGRYLKNLADLVELSNPKLLILNGERSGELTGTLEFAESSIDPIIVTDLLSIHLGTCLRRKTAWFDHFLGSHNANPNGTVLFDVGKKLKKALESPTGWSN